MGESAGQIRQENFSDTVESLRKELKKEVGPLNEQEREFFSNFMKQDFYLTHATRVKPENKKGDLILYSHKGLQDKGIGFNPGTTAVDIGEYGNNDYVFFGLEAGEKPKKTWSNFGQKFYRAQYDLPAFTHSALMLVDPIIGTAQNPSRISGLSADGVQKIFSTSYPFPRSIFQGRAESLTALGYKLIATARELSPEDRQRVLSARTDEEVNNVVNGIFRPQVMVPKRVGLKKEDVRIHQPK